MTTSNTRTPDPRWVAIFQQQEDLANSLSRWEVGEAVPAGIADVLRTVRKLVIDSYYEYDYTLVAGAWGWLTLEACLRGCMPGRAKGRTGAPLAL